MRENKKKTTSVDSCLCKQIQCPTTIPTLPYPTSIAARESQEQGPNKGRLDPFPNWSNNRRGGRGKSDQLRVPHFLPMPAPTVQAKRSQFAKGNVERRSGVAPWGFGDGAAMERSYSVSCHELSVKARESLTAFALRPIARRR